MDIASIHRNQRVGYLCAAANLYIEHLPPYSPFLNHIELNSHDLKTYIRRNYRLQDDGAYVVFEDFLKDAVKKMAFGLDARKKARGCFRHSGYDFDNII